MHPAFRLCWIALLVQPPASALLMGYGTSRRQRHGLGAGPMMIRGDKESFTDYYTRRNAGAAGAPAAVADSAAADTEVAQKVRGVLAAAQQKYDIPADYVRMLDGVCLCRMQGPPRFVSARMAPSRPHQRQGVPEAATLRPASANQPLVLRWPAILRVCFDARSIFLCYMLERTLSLTLKQTLAQAQTLTLTLTRLLPLLHVRDTEGGPQHGLLRGMPRSLGVGLRLGLGLG